MSTAVDCHAGDSRVVHQILISSIKRPGVPDNARVLADQVGSSNHRLWELEDCRTFLGDRFGPEVITAFDTLRPFAYKADLGRYCIVFALGGYYLDLSVTDAVLFDPASHDFIGFRDLNSDATSWKVGNNFFFARSGCAILGDCIDQVLRNVSDRYFGKDPHFPTGPSVLGRAVANKSLDLDVLIGQYWWFKRRRSKYTLPGHGVVGRGKIGGRYLGGVSGVPGGNNYNELWRSRAIYDESP